ncbi:hypothetical protein Tco_0836521 [Tanacetum coccineum]
MDIKGISKFCDATLKRLLEKVKKFNLNVKHGCSDLDLRNENAECMRDVEEEAKVAKASEDMKLSIMKEKFLAMVESEKTRVKDYTKLVVTDGMVDYVLEKYRNK